MSSRPESTVVGGPTVHAQVEAGGVRVLQDGGRRVVQRLHAGRQVDRDRPVGGRVREGLGQVHRGLEARGRVLGHGLQQDAFEGPRGVGRVTVDRGHRLVDVLGQEAHRRIGGIGQPPGHDLEEHHAQRIDVRPRVGAGRFDGLLRGHVGRRADPDPGRGQGRHDRGALVGHLGDAEVRELGDVQTRQQHVGGLDVAVDDAVLVGVLQGIRDLADQARGALEGQHALVQQVLERAAADVFHHDVGQAVRLAGGEDAHDVRVVEDGDRARFPLEAAQELGIVGEVARQDLDRDDLAGLGVAAAIDRGHAAPVDQVLQQVAPYVTPDEVLLHPGPLGSPRARRESGTRPPGPRPPPSYVFDKNNRGRARSIPPAAPFRLRFRCVRRRAYSPRFRRLRRSSSWASTSL